MSGSGITYTRAVVCLVVLLICAGCAKSVTPPPPPLSAMQREYMQTKELSGDFETVFGSVLSVLQDEGWQIEAVDKSAGLIQASSLKRQALIGPSDDWRGANDPRIREIKQEAAKAENQGLPVRTWTRWEQLTARIEPWGDNTVRTRISIVKCGRL